jgi:hypothetical protein
MTEEDRDEFLMGAKEAGFKKESVMTLILNEY